MRFCLTPKLILTLWYVVFLSYLPLSLFFGSFLYWPILFLSVYSLFTIFFVTFYFGKNITVKYILLLIFPIIFSLATVTDIVRSRF